MTRRDANRDHLKRVSMLLAWWWLLLVGLVVVPGRGHAVDLNTLIDRIQQRYDRTRALTADFVQVATLTSIDRQQTSAGHLYIEKPHYLRWEYTQPAPQTILYDGAMLRIYTPNRQQLLQSAMDETDRGNVALLFLAGVGRLRETFTITPVPTTDAHVQRLRLLPRSHQASFTELRIAVNNQSYFVEQLTIHDTIGNVTDIHLSALQVHQALPSQTFELILPPQTEILTPTDLSGRR